MFTKVRILALVCGVAAIFSFGCTNSNTSADMNSDAKCCKTGETCTAKDGKDGKCCGACKDGAAAKQETKKEETKK